MQMGERLKRRMEMGFKYLKMDVGIDLVADVPGAISAPPEVLETHHIMHPFTGIQLTKKGVDWLVDYVATVREIIGDEVPLAVHGQVRPGLGLDRRGRSQHERGAGREAHCERCDAHSHRVIHASTRQNAARRSMTQNIATPPIA